MVLEGEGDGHGHGHVQDHQDMMQCMNHPYKNSNTPAGGICAFCLQEKLGKLVSSSFPIAIFPSSSSSSSPHSFRSDHHYNAHHAHAHAHYHHPSSSTTTNITALPPTATTNNNSNDGNNTTRYHQYSSSSRSTSTRMPFLLIQRKKKKKETMMTSSSNNNKKNNFTTAGADAEGVVFKRSKSTTTPRRNIYSDNPYEFSPRRRGFWSFISKSSSASTARKPFREISDYRSNISININAATTNVEKLGNGCLSDQRSIDESQSQSQSGSCMERRVSRSRSVGCGSRSFSGVDLFERISTGLGDCTLRRVESQREGNHIKPRPISTLQQQPQHDNSSIKERVKCGGIFGGFMMSSSSSSSSSSSYWVSNSSSVEDNGMIGGGVGGKVVAARAGHIVPHMAAHGRSRSWGWALASPIRAFGGKPSSGKRDGLGNKNATPNLAAIPSLLAV